MYAVAGIANHMFCLLLFSVEVVLSSIESRSAHYYKHLQRDENAEGIRMHVSCV